MLKKNEIPKPKKGKAFLDDLVQKQKYHTIQEILEELYEKFPYYFNSTAMNHFTYKDVQFAFGDALNIFGKAFVVLAVSSEDKTVRVISQDDLINLFNGTDEVLKKSTWISLIKYMQRAELKDIKKPII